MMFTEERIFDERIISNGKVSRKVLYTPFPITGEFIPKEIRIYTLLKKINGGYIISWNTNNIEECDFAGTILSAHSLVIGDSITMDENPMSRYYKTNIETYMAVQISTMKIFVIQPMHDVDLSDFDKVRESLRKMVAFHFKRDIDDVELIDQLHVDDPYDIDENFSSERERRIYRLTRSMRMLSKATHVIVLPNAEKASGCRVEIETMRAYHIPHILMDEVIHSCRKTIETDIVEALKVIQNRFPDDLSRHLGEEWMKPTRAVLGEESQPPFRTHPLEGSPRFIKEEY